jgi:hypothetical protein
VSGTRKAAASTRKPTTSGYYFVARTSFFHGTRRVGAGEILRRGDHTVETCPELFDELVLTPSLMVAKAPDGTLRVVRG